MEYIKKYYNWIVLCLLVVTVTILLVTYFIGKSENEKFAQDQMNFHLALQAIEMEDNLEQAYQLLIDLEEDYQDNHYVNWQLGWTVGRMGDYKEGIKYFLKAQDQNPVLTRDPIFLIQFAWVMLQDERYDEAKVYLEHSREQIGITDEQLEIVDNWLQLVELEKGKTQEES